MLRLLSTNGRVSVVLSKDEGCRPMLDMINKTGLGKYPHVE